MKHKPQSVRLFIYLLIGFFVYWIIVPLTYHATADYNEETITITPPTVEITVNPGEEKEGVLGLISDAPGDVQFAASVYDLIVTDSEGTPQVVPPGVLVNNRFSAANWIALYPHQITAHPHERVNVSYYLQVPQNAAPGGHYAAIIYTRLPGVGKQTSGAQIQPQVGTLIYIQVRGKFHEGAQVTQFTTPWFQEFGPAGITTQIKNTGDLHINLQGVITLKNMFGKTVDIASLPSRNIFPGNVSLIYHLKLGRTLMFGRYTALLTATYGVGNNYSLSASVSFWVIPWRLLLLFLLALIVATLGILLWRKKQNPKQELPEEAIEPGAQPQ